MNDLSDEQADLKRSIVRRKCFRRMFPGPRTVEVLFAQKTGSEKHEFLADTPIVLFICKESRQEALSFYTLAFGGKHASNPVYFDPKSDTLYLRDLCYPRRQDRVHPQMFLLQLTSKDIVEKLALSTGCFSNTKYYLDNNLPPASELTSFHNLREITFVMDLSSNASDSEVLHHERRCHACRET